MRIIELTGTGDAGGALTLESSQFYEGFIEKIVYDWIDGDTLADFTFTNEGPVSLPVLTVTNAGVADVTWFPRTTANKVADASAFTNVAEKIMVTGKMKVVVAAGGISKQFRFLIYLSDL